MRRDLNQNNATRLYFIPHLLQVEILYCPCTFRVSYDRLRYSVKYFHDYLFKTNLPSSLPMDFIPLRNLKK
jgi:hypothetical protein